MFSIVLLSSILFISALFFNVSFLLQIYDLICSFSHSLRCNGRLFMVFYFHFNLGICHYNLKITHKFWYVVLSCICLKIQSQNIKKMFSLFISSLSENIFIVFFFVGSKVYYLILHMCEFFNFLSDMYFYFHPCIQKVYLTWFKSS